jgi:hypothetical protein
MVEVEAERFPSGSATVNCLLVRIEPTDLEAERIPIVLLRPLDVAPLPSLLQC